MNITHVAASDGAGGAALAGYRIHRALVEYATALGVSSSMRVCDRVTSDPKVTGGACTRTRVRRALRFHLHRLRTQGFNTKSDAFHSVAWPATGLGAELARSNADIVHLHWLGRDTISVEEIGTLPQPVVWTLHDMWPLCGAEHYSDDRRYADGYRANNRPAYESGPDINRWTWRRKRRAWQRSMRIVCTSRWMAECVQRSALMHDWPASIIPLPIDLAAYAPMQQEVARTRLGLPSGVPIVLYGAIGGLADRRKGADLLLEALARLQQLHDPEALRGLQLVVFGEDRPADAPAVKFPVHFAGVLRDDESLRLHYAAADVMAVPSRQEALGQTACESMACGTPVVAFRVGGLPDVVTHQSTGYLAEPLDVGSLAAGIQWVLSDSARRFTLGAAARTFAELRWSPESVAHKYAELYGDVLSRLHAGS